MQSAWVYRASVRMSTARLSRGSEEGSDACSERHCKGAPERDAHRAHPDIGAPHPRSQRAQVRIPLKLTSDSDRN